MEIEKLTGKSLIFTDIHCGINNDKPSRQKISENLVNELITYIEKEDVKQVFFCGDMFHQRVSIDVTSLNLANNIVRKIAKHCKLYLIQGNHDLYEKFNATVTSLNVFDIENVEVISTPREVNLNGQNVLLVPWLCGQTLESFLPDPTKKYDIMMGHFDVSAESQISYAARNFESKFKVSTVKEQELSNSALDELSGILGENVVNVQHDSMEQEGNKVVMEIIEHSNPFSTIFLGHIHEHSVICEGGRKFIIVGSPQTQQFDMKGALTDEKKQHGFYLLDERNKETFYELSTPPKFIVICSHDFLDFDLDSSILKNAIIRRCYDCVMTDEQRKKFDEFINNAGIYEEDSSTFVFGASRGAVFNDVSTPESDISELVSNNKMDYLTKMVDALEIPEAIRGKINKDALKTILKRYYTAIEGGIEG